MRSNEIDKFGILDLLIPPQRVILRRRWKPSTMSVQCIIIEKIKSRILVVGVEKTPAVQE